MAGNKRRSINVRGMSNVKSAFYNRVAATGPAASHREQDNWRCVSTALKERTGAFQPVVACEIELSLESFTQQVPSVKVLK
jgi:hypothetical protein